MFIPKPPPRVKTQHPKVTDIPTQALTPIPIETVFFLEDGKQDIYQPNRYYFDYPGNWSTANNGENIIGLRSIKIQRMPIKLEFTIELAKYTKDNYMIHFQNNHNETINYFLDSKIGFAKSKEIQIICWISANQTDFDNLFNIIHETMMYNIDKGFFGSYWVQNPNIVLDRDISAEGIYDYKGYHIKIFSERNRIGKDDYCLSFKIKEANQNFKELFNINNIDIEWQEEIIFDKVWDLKPCNVFSSFGEQALHHYVGTTDSEYSEIKYFKLNSADQKFWIEFHSMGRQSSPSYFPKNVSFAIELQFQSFNKNLKL